MKKFLTILAGTLIGFVALAQNVKVSGTVVAKDDGFPLPGVAVVVKGTLTGTQTDLDGLYELSVPAGSTLVFSYISFRDHEVVVKAEGVYDVAMETDALELLHVDALQPVDRILYVGRTDARDHHFVDI